MKWKEFHSEHPYTHQLDPTINILLYLYLFDPSIHRCVLFFMHFKVNCNHQYISS